jgi:hypothetical protein
VSHFQVRDAQRTPECAARDFWIFVDSPFSRGIFPAPEVAKMLVAADPFSSRCLLPKPGM